MYLIKFKSKNESPVFDKYLAQDKNTFYFCHCLTEAHTFRKKEKAEKIAEQIKETCSDVYNLQVIEIKATYNK